jgi:DNA-binding protein HU-beta
MAKKDTDLFDRLRDAGLRKQVAKTLGDLGEGASKKAHERARGLASELRSLADEIERRLPSVTPRATTRRKPATSAAGRKTASASTRRKPASSTAGRKPATATTARKTSSATAARKTSGATTRKPAASRAATPKPRASSGGAAAAKPAARATRAKRPTGSTGSSRGRSTSS